MEEGYIKFKVDWQVGKPLPRTQIEELNRCRQRLYKLGLVGAYKDGTGYGNVSCRCGSKNEFVISGSKTGNFPVLDENHYTVVKEVNSEHNQVCCEGPIVASSESMSHAVIYDELSEVKVVIHVHNLELWKFLLHRLPTTDASAPYGSPEMVNSIRQLLCESDLRKQRIFVMEGHEEGVFAFGDNFENAERVLYHWLETSHATSDSGCPADGNHSCPTSISRVLPGHSLRA
mmetsp:Transcript_9562/g.23005  ORF Transcript_9562/g.23005 Transcript_9562/m.23005 type:complete len:231 (+) Transcript_9562:142-834(+)